jgi:hypothetical protein
LFAVALLSINILLGFWIGDLQSVADDVVDARRALDATKRHLTSSPDETETLKQELSAATRAFTPVRDRVRIHVLCGIAGTLVTILVNSITVTYFIGTTRWCHEVVDTYHLDEDLAERSRLLKKSAFPWAIIGILTVMAIVVMGAVSDPSSSNFENSHRWVIPHQLAAIAGTLVIGWAMLMQVGKIGANYDVIEEILDEVRKVRQARGLEDIPEQELERFRL